MSNGQTDYFRELRGLIDQYFGENDLKEISFDLGVEYESLEGDAKPIKVISLIKHLARLGRLQELILLLTKERGQVNWPVIPEPAQQKEDMRTTSFLSRQGLRDEQYQIALHWDGETRMREFDLSGRNLSRMNLAGADLAGAKLRGADLNESDLSKADLSGADLHRANLWNANLSEARLLDRPNLFHADLNEANLRRVKMFAANLHGAHLRHADLSEAELPVDLSRADLSAANLRGADLSGAYKLMYATLSGAEYDTNTQWPIGFDPQELGAILIDD